MKAIAQTQLGGPHLLRQIEVPIPTVSEPRDLLVKIKAVAVNPVDFKKGKGSGKLDNPLILGWDASGIVEDIGKEVKFYKKGDEVMFAGSIKRPGCNAEYCLVDERITGRKPKNISFEEAAAIPLTGLTAWEGMMESMHIPLPHSEEEEQKNKKKSILVIAGAGGVGSIAIQIAKKILKLQVVATASRPETVSFCKEMGADLIVNHKEDLAEEFKKIGLSGVDYILNSISPDESFEKAIKVLNPFGYFCTIVDGNKPLPVSQMMVKRQTYVFELMFTRPIFGIELERQRDILNSLADLVEKKVIVPRVTKHYPNMSFLSEAHKTQESGTVIGKTVLSAVFE